MDRAVFLHRAGDWATWQETPWGRLRYRVVARTIARATASLQGPLTVLDVGGGDGADSLPLAVAGHQVTVLDYAEPFLAMVRERAAAANVADRVRTVCADLDDLGAQGLFGPDSHIGFDLVLCHNVLHYRPDVEADVAALVSLCSIGGVLSVMAPNPAMDVLSAVARRGDPTEALAVLHAPTVRVVTFDHEARRLEPEVVETALVAAGHQVQHRFGIRCVMDLMADDEVKSDPARYDALEELELALCERDPYRRAARFWQLTSTAEPAA